MGYFFSVAGKRVKGEGNALPYARVVSLRRERSSQE